VSYAMTLRPRIGAWPISLIAILLATSAACSRTLPAPRPILVHTLRCLDQPPPLLSAEAVRDGVVEPGCPVDFVCLRKPAAIAWATWSAVVTAWAREAFARCGPLPSPSPSSAPPSATRPLTGPAANRSGLRVEGVPGTTLMPVRASHARGLSRKQCSVARAVLRVVALPAPGRAVTAPGSDPLDVLADDLVTLGTDTGPNPNAGQASNGVLAERDRIQVPRVHARGRATQMVEAQALRYRPPEVLVARTVGRPETPGQKELAVAERRERSSPNPAPDLGDLGDLCLEPSKRKLVHEASLIREGVRRQDHPVPSASGASSDSAASPRPWSSGRVTVAAGRTRGADDA
jgi:hypothetical protein